MKLYNMFFSATGSTKAIAKEISIGTGIEKVIDIDLTLPKDGKEGIFISKDDLFLISLPVYSGMIPYMHTLRVMLNSDFFWRYSLSGWSSLSSL
ncbi:hypothetical protein ACFLWZ_06750 [Chloroflexota bacterium]